MFLSKADLFGYPLEPTFKGQTKINTVLGGFVSLLLITLFTFGFFFVGKEIIEKKNPISNMSTIRMDQASVSLKDIPLIFALVSYQGEFLHLNKEFTRAAKLNAGLYEVSTSDNGQVRYFGYNVPLVFCTKDLLGEDYYEVVESTQAGLEYALCVDYTNVTTLDGSKHPDGIPSIRNPFGVQNSAHLLVFLELCDELIDPGCRKGIDSVGSFHFVVSHPQGILNISSNSDPIFTEMKSLQTTAFVGLAFNQVINYNLNELVSDEGWVLENNQISTFYSADPPIYNATQFSENDKAIGRCTFSMNLAKNVINRRYMKLQELIANLGGFVKVAIMFFSFFLRSYSKWSLYLEIGKVRVKAQTEEKNSSTTIINNIVSENIVEVNKKNLKMPSFKQFLMASVCNKYKLKYRVDWQDSLKYLDLLFMKNQSENLKSCLDKINSNT